MRSSKSRSRNKSNRQRTLGNVVNRVFDSSGPEGKVRGTPQQIIDKYLALARDAQLSSDRVAEQSFLQHAEHYTRMLGEAQREMAERQQQSGQRGEGEDQPRFRDDRRDGGEDRGQDRRDDRRRDEAPRETASDNAFPPARDVAAEVAGGTDAGAAPELIPAEAPALEAAAPAETPAETMAPAEVKAKPRRTPRTAAPRAPRAPRKPKVAEAPNGVASGE